MRRTGGSASFGGAARAATLWAVAVTVASPIALFARPATRVSAAPPQTVETLTGFPTAENAAQVPQAPYQLTVTGAASAGVVSVVVADPINHMLRSLNVSLAIRAGVPLAESPYAGDGGYGNGPDGAPPLETQLSGPYATALDAQSGDIYIADTYAHIVRVIHNNAKTPASLTLVGTAGQFGYSGDRGPAQHATLNSPYGIAFDGQTRTLYVADTLNNVIRKVALGLPGTPITTVAGTGAAGSSDGPGSSARFNEPRGIVFAGDRKLYIADTGNNKIRVFDPSTSAVSTVAGSGQAGFKDGQGSAAQFDQPAGLDFERAGPSLLVADTGNDVIRRVQVNSTAVTTVAGTPRQSGSSGDCTGSPSSCPLATAAKLNSPFGVTALQNGGILIADTLNYSVRYVDEAGHLWHVAGNGHKSFYGDGVAETSAEISGASSVAFVPPPPPAGDISALDLSSDGGVVFADPYNNVVRVISGSGQVTTLAGSGQAGFSGDCRVNPAAPCVDASDAQLNSPFGVAAYESRSDGSLTIYVADTFNNRVRAITFPSGGSAGGSPSPAPAPSAIITTVAGTGVAGFSGDGGAATAAKLSFPIGVSVDGSGNLYIADSYNARIRKVDANAARDGSHHISTVAGTGKLGFQPSDEGGSATSAHLYFPYGVTADANGSSGFLVADSFDNRVLAVDGGGAVKTIAGVGTAGSAGDSGPATHAQLDRPWAAIPDAAGDGVLIADHMNNKVRSISASGGITTLAGSGQGGDRGDGGSASLAELSGPRGLAIGSGGGILAADSMSDRVRVIGSVDVTESGSGAFGDVLVNCDGSGSTEPCPDDNYVTLSNNGNVPAPLLLSITTDGPGDQPGSENDFSMSGGGPWTACSSVINPTESCVVSVAFHPRVVGPRQASLTVTTAGSTSRFTLTGSGQGQLVFTHQPASCKNVYNGPFDSPCQPALVVDDARGSVLSAPTEVASRRVFLTLQSSTGATLPAGAGLTCTGGNPAPVTGGQVQFAGCKVSAPTGGAGATFTLSANDASATEQYLRSASSRPFSFPTLTQ